MAGKDYFGKNNIRPSFLSHSDAKNLLKTTEKIATENTSLKSPSFSYHPDVFCVSKLRNLSLQAALVAVLADAFADEASLDRKSVV